jgi:hypothetical protein
MRYLVTERQLYVEGKGKWRVATMEELEAWHIKNVLGYTRGNRRKAARLLGLAFSTVYRKLRRYHLDGETRSLADRIVALPAIRLSPEESTGEEEERWRRGVNERIAAAVASFLNEILSVEVRAMLLKLL